ncbi:MAG: Fic family protein [Rhodobacteraceae bacterium]|nr:Fic family protein [Paracoccaceae bacterium]MDE2917344.1 Fic family protein [Paracoccaceae bacterium]MYE36261.1 Fic family protein [Paracoccaceae bacterium]MYG41991.1 Fic family protein [Paracoccaceae bacterium]
MYRGLQGHYITISTVGENVRAYVPAPLPPAQPIEWTSELRDKFDQALLALGRLDSISVLLPNTSHLLFMYVRKEAVLSSMIEGTQSSLTDLLLFESKHQPGVPLDDVQEVSNYVAALSHGLNRLNENFPLSLRLMKDIHSVLLSKGPGKEYNPGEFRRSQNWIGGNRPGTATFVPPPPEYIQECMGKLELFYHDKPEKTSTLIKAALTHVQFETIHPFLDGNGRLGRLFITLLLSSEKVLNAPMLYLSLYFKTHRSRYYELLNEVRLTGDWEAWLDFFADAVIHTSIQAVGTAQKLMKLSEDDDIRIKSLKRTSGSASLIHKAILERPLASPNWIKVKTRLSPATVNACLRELEQLGIVKEKTGQKRNRLYSYEEYIRIMNDGNELPR